MKSVLISIRPKWAEKIAKGEKTIEVRKSRPKIETPFKCYIYCTKAKSKWRLSNYEGAYENSTGEIVYAQQHIIGEFICDGITGYRYTKPWLYNGKKIYHLPIDTINTRLSYDEIEQYLGNKDGYGWHISNLKIYDKPKELSEFRTPCKHTISCWTCHNFDTLKLECIRSNCEVPRPPKSWLYVEEV